MGSIQHAQGEAARTGETDMKPLFRSACERIALLTLAVSCTAVLACEAGAPNTADVSAAVTGFISPCAFTYADPAVSGAGCSVYDTYWDDTYGVFCIDYDPVTEPDPCYHTGAEAVPQHEQTCKVDGDGDGYPTSSAASVTVASWETEEGNDRFIDCRTLGLANQGKRNANFMRFDCDDSDANRHPRRTEGFWRDGNDENCDNYDHDDATSPWSDEAEFVYRVDMNDSPTALYLELMLPIPSATELQLPIRVRYCEVGQLDSSRGCLAADEQEQIYYYEGASRRRGPTFELGYHEGRHKVSMTLTGLRSGTLYAVTAGLGCDPSGTTCQFGSNTYFGMTVGATRNARSKLVQRAMYEYNLSERGLVGRNADCAVNGWRYVDYESGDDWRSKYRYWCDLFAASLYRAYLTGFDRPDDAEDCDREDETGHWNPAVCEGSSSAAYFAAKGRFWARGDKTAEQIEACGGAFESFELPTHDAGEPGGDWFPRGSNELRPGDYVRACGHTMMFLAYSSEYNTDDQIWVIEGNSGNQVKISQKTANCDSDGCIYGFGRVGSLLRGEVDSHFTSGTDYCGLDQFSTVFTPELASVREDG